MALKRKAPKMDPPEVIRARERMKPVDWTELEFSDPSIQEKFHFCWVHEGEHMMGLYASLGYVPVDSKKDGVRGAVARGNRNDNLVHHLDMILHKIPIEQYRAMEREREMMGKYQLDRRFEANKEAGAAVGIDVRESLRVGDTERLDPEVPDGEEEELEE